jgi:hypothetical protein
MIVRVECMGRIHEATGLHEIIADIASPATVAVLLDQLGIQFPELATFRGRLSILAGLDYVDESHPLSADETISLTVE